MATEDLGTLRLGITADLSELEKELERANERIKGFKIPNRDIVFQIRVREPSQKVIDSAQRKVNSTLEKAAKLGVELTPTLTVKNVKIAEFRNEIQRLFDKGDPVKVKIGADVDGQALRDQILGEVGVVDIPLTWHWAGEPPPSGSGGSGGGGGTRTPPTGSPPAAPSHGVPVAAPVKPPVSGVGAVIQPPKPGKKATPSQAAPAQAKPAQAKISQPVAPVAPAAVPAPPPVPSAGAGPAPVIQAPKNLMTRTKDGIVPGMTEDQIVEARVANAVMKLTRGRPEGLQALLSMGGVLHPDTDAPISAKKRSQLDKYLQAKPGAMDALTAALGIYRQSEEPEPGRAAFTGGARSLAGELPGAQSPQAIRRIREMIEADARARRSEFSKREDVQLFKAAFKEHGFAAFGAADDLQAPEGSILAERTGGTSGIGGNLVDAYNLRATDPGKAREKAVEALTIFASLFPKDFRKLFPAKAKGKDPKIGTSRQTKSGEGVDPALEAVGAAIQSIFGDLYTKSVPRRDAQAKVDRKLDMEARSTPSDEPLPGAPPVETSRQFATPGESAILKAVRKGAEPLEAAQKAFTKQFGKEEKPGQFDAFFASLDQQAIQKAIQSRGSSTSEGEKRRQQILREMDKKVRQTAPSAIDPYKIKMLEPTTPEQARAARQASTVRPQISDAQAAEIEQRQVAEKKAQDDAIARMRTRKRAKGGPVRRGPGPLHDSGPEFRGPKGMQANYEEWHRQKRIKQSRLAKDFVGAPVADEFGNYDNYGRMDFAFNPFEQVSEDLFDPTRPGDLPEKLKKRLKHNAQGGAVKKGGLLGLLHAKGVPLPEGAYIVGEEGEELFVPKTDGHIIDNKAQNIPEWLRRSKAGEGRGKDMTGRMRKDGGPVKAGGGASIEALKKAIAANPDGPIADQLRNAIKFLEKQQGPLSADSLPAESKAILDELYPAAPAAAPVIKSPFAAGAKKVSKPKAAAPKAEAKPRGAVEVSSVDERDFGTPPEEPAKPKAVARPKAAAKPKAPAKPKAAPVIRGAVEVSSTDERDFGEPPPTPPKAAPKPKVQVPGLPPGHTFTPGADPKPKAAPAPVAAAPKAAAAPKTPAPAAVPLKDGVRVFVVNWPPGLTGSARSAPASATAAGPVDALVGPLAIARAATKKTKAAKATAGAEPDEDDGAAFKPSRRNALERVKAEAEVEDEFLALKFGIQNVSAQRSSQLSQLAQRGVQTASGEILSTTLGGRSNAVERARRAEAIQQQANQRAGQFRKELITLGKLERDLGEAREKGAKPKVIAELTEQFNNQTEAVKFLKEETIRLTGEAGEATGQIASMTDKVKVFGTNTLGIIGGTLLFGGALTLAQGAIGGISTLLSPAIERMTGFKAKTAEVTGALADQVRASGGAVDQVTALSLATTGLSAANADLVGPLIAQRAETEAGNKALQEQIDSLHAWQELRRQSAQGAAGFDTALVRTSGGLFGSDLGGQASTAELLVKELNAGPDLAQRLSPPSERKQVPARVVGGVLDVQNPDLDKFNAALDNSQKTLDVFNNQARKGGESVLRLSMASEQQSLAAYEIARQSPLLKDFAETLKREGLQVEGAKTPEDFLRFIQAINQGGPRPDAELLVRQMNERIIPNQLAAFEAEANFQLQKIIPAGRSLDFLAAPPTPFGAGFTQVQQGTNGAAPIGAAPISGIEGVPAVDANATQSFNNYRTVAQSAIDAVIAKAREGKAALLEMGVPPSLIAEMETLGNQAQGIEIGIANQQAAFDATQYNHQLFILNRNLADARALLGQNVGAQGRLGALQRENFELGKKQHALQIQAQELQLNLTQRQINFQRAIAGFVAPGTTPEERAARIEQAKIEADFAQKQLDIQKQLLGLGKKQFVVGVQIFDESAKRQVQDLQFALSELKQARALQLDTRAAQQAIAAIRARQAQVNAEIGVGIEKSIKTASLRISTALDIANKSGETFGRILVTVGTAFNRALRIAFAPLTNFNAGGGNHPVSDKNEPGAGYARGIVGDTLGPTNITVGEAGKEKVAVVKNPKNVSLQSLAGVAPSGGSGVMVIVDVHDNNVEKDTLDALVAKVSAAVETSLNRKTSLFGLRRA